MAAIWWSMTAMLGPLSHPLTYQTTYLPTFPSYLPTLLPNYLYTVTGRLEWWIRLGGGQIGAIWWSTAAIDIGPLSRAINRSTRFGLGEFLWAAIKLPSSQISFILIQFAFQGNAHPVGWSTNSCPSVAKQLRLRLCEICDKVLLAGRLILIVVQSYLPQPNSKKVSWYVLIKQDIAECQKWRFCFLERRIRVSAGRALSFSPNWAGVSSRETENISRSWDFIRELETPPALSCPAGGSTDWVDAGKEWE